MATPTNQLLVQGFKTSLSLSAAIVPRPLLEKLWLEQELATTVSSNVDGWNKLFAAAGVTSGGFNERQFKWLATLGHTASTLPARMNEFAESLANPPVTLDAAQGYTGYALSNGNLTQTGAASVWGHRYATLARSAGKFAFEATVDLSVSTQIGFAETRTAASGVFPGSAIDTWGVSAAGDFFNNGSPESGDANAVHGTGDTLMVACDIDTGDVIVIASDFSVEVTDWVSEAFAGNAIYPAFGSFGLNCAITVNFGATAFVNTLPTGYAAWDGS